MMPLMDAGDCSKPPDTPQRLPVPALVNCIRNYNDRYDFARALEREVINQF
jgi:hypothetical protein